MPPFCRHPSATDIAPGTSGSATVLPSWRMGCCAPLMVTDCSSAPTGKVNVCSPPRELRRLAVKVTSVDDSYTELLRLVRGLVAGAPPRGRRHHRPLSRARLTLCALQARLTALLGQRVLANALDGHHCCSRAPGGEVRRVTTGVEAPVIADEALGLRDGVPTRPKVCDVAGVLFRA